MNLYSFFKNHIFSLSQLDKIMRPITSSDGTCGESIMNRTEQKQRPTPDLASNKNRTFCEKGGHVLYRQCTEYLNIYIFTKVGENIYLGLGGYKNIFRSVDLF